jgi:hypothetical protein
MARTKARKSETRSEEEILDQAILQLLRAVKDHVAADGRELTREQMLKDGYSERFIEKVENA